MLDTCGKWRGFRFNFPFLVGNFGEFEWAKKKEGKEKKRNEGEREKITRFVSFRSNRIIIGIFQICSISREEETSS